VFSRLGNNDKKSTQKPYYLVPLTVKLKNVQDSMILNRNKGIDLESD